MTREEIAVKYAFDKSEYKEPYYMINGKKSSHLDLISLARRLGLPTNVRNSSTLGFAQEVASGKNPKYQGKILDAAKKFVSMVKGPFKE